MESISAVAAALSQSLGRLDPAPVRSIHGGTINDCYRWEGARGPLFVKLAAADRLAMFEAEAAGLDELRRAKALHVPEVLAVGRTEEFVYLALEWIDLHAPSAGGQEAMGRQLTLLHGVTAETFGWFRDNTIGDTPQINLPAKDWLQFFRQHRLQHQFSLARQNGHLGRLQERGAELLEHVADFFVGHQPMPSLLHGDLWGGNWGVDQAGRPVIFDPAVYYGDRETDLAMTQLFGGFGPQFYAAYHAAWPPEAGASTRSVLYNLYHVLNHLNLFGEGYRRQAESMVDQLLAELGR